MSLVHAMATVMASGVSPAELRPLLLGTMQVDASARRAAEATVEQLKALPGFASALCFLALQQDALELRQLAALVLKQFVRAHWSDEDETYGLDAEGSTAARVLICEAEKAAVRSALPAGLADPVPRIRTAVSMIIAAIAQWDWPDEWPGLMRELLAPLEAATSSSTTAAVDSASAVAGVLRCLELCAAELQEEHVTDALRSLMPLLLRLVVGPRVQARRERARAVRVLNKLLERVATVCVDQGSVRRLQRGYLKEWAGTALRTLMSSASDASDAGLTDCSLELALLRLVRLLIVSLPRALDEHVDGLLPPIGALLLRAVRALELESRLCEPAAAGGATAAGAAAYDSDGGALGVAALVSGVLDVLSALAASSRFYRRLLPVLPDVTHAAIALMRIPPDTESEWASDLSQYLHDEDPDSFSVSPRIAAQQLIDELLDAYGKKALPPLLQAVGARMDESGAMRAQQLAGHWWRLREGALLTISLAAPVLGEAARIALKKGTPPPMQPEHVVREQLLPDAAAGNPPLLRARALCTAARLAPHVPLAAVVPLLHACRAALAPSEPAALRLAVCRALLDLCSAAQESASSVPAELDSSFGELLPLVVPLFEQESEDAVLLALEATGGLLRRSAHIAAAAEGWLTPLLLRLWSARCSEHLTSSAIVDAIRALASSAAVLPSVVSKVLPVIAEVLQLQHATQQAVSAERSAVAGGDISAAQLADPEDEPDAVDPLLAAVEILEICMRRWPPNEPLPPAAYTHVLPLLLAVLGTAADVEVVRVGTSCLGKLLRHAVRMHPGEPPQALGLAHWPPALESMLRPGMREELVEAVAPLVGALAMHTPAFFEQHAVPLVGALAGWLGRARLFGVVQAAMLAYAQIVLTQGAGAELLIRALRATPERIHPGALATPHAASGGESGDGALPFVLRMWVDCANDVLHPYSRKAIVAALVELVSPRWPQLCSLTTAADAPPEDTGRTTRSATRARRGQRADNATQQVPILVRAFRLSVRMHQAVAAAGGDERDGAGVRGRVPHGHAMAAQLWPEEEEDDEEDDDEEWEEDEEEDEEEEGGGAEEAEALAEMASSRRHAELRIGRPSPFVPADSAKAYSVVNLSDMLDYASGEESDEGSEDADDYDDATDPIRTLDLGSRLASYVRVLNEALGQQQFEQLCATLQSDEERHEVGKALARGV